MNEILRRRMEAVKNGTAVKAEVKKPISSNEIIQRRLEKVEELEAKGVIPPKEVRIKEIQEFRGVKEKREKKEKKPSKWTKEYKRLYRREYYQREKEKIKENRLRREALNPKKYKTSVEQREKARVREKRYYAIHREEILATKKLERQQRNENKSIQK